MFVVRSAEMCLTVCGDIPHTDTDRPTDISPLYSQDSLAYVWSGGQQHCVDLVPFRGTADSKVSKISMCSIKKIME